MIENERAYMFTHEAADGFMERQQLTVKRVRENICDWYLNPNLRVRQLPGQEGFKLTRKYGDKSEGYRTEEERKISRDVATLLTTDSKLFIRKNCFDFGQLTFDGKRSYRVTLDFINQPMKVAILEIESLSENPCPVPDNIIEELFNEKLKECPLSSFNYFRRKVGICGTASGGKIETAKWITHVLNTQYDGNAFNVAEYATNFIQEHGRPPEFEDQLVLLLGQLDREKNAQTADFIVSDCPVFLNYVYCLHLNKKELSERSAILLSEIYQRVLFDLLTYDNLFLLKLIRYKENRVRFQGFEKAQEIQERIYSFLDDHQVEYSAVTYNDSARILDQILYLN